MLLFLMINFIVFFFQIETFFLSINNNHLFIECARSIIIKNHYWFLSEFLYLLKQTNSTTYQTIPFDYLYLILNHISIHCQPAHQFYQKTRQTQKLDLFYQWLKSQIKN